MQTQDYKIGDEFRLIDGFGDRGKKGRRGPNVSKDRFQITDVHDGYVYAVNPEDPPNDWAPRVFHVALTTHIDTGNVEWLVVNGTAVINAPVVEPDAEVKEFAAAVLFDDEDGPEAAVKLFA